jgi:DNA-binding MarR family transcriptional regulator
MHPATNAYVQQMHTHMCQHVQELTGETEIGGLELATMIHALANLYDSAEVPPDSAFDLSGPRWGLLLRLLHEEAKGSCAGLTPTSLSRFQNVTKNTISALLRGLEDQGLIQRALDPDDRRLFRIQLSEVGRKLTRAEAPRRIRHLNRLAAGLSEADQAQLVDLLGRLFGSIVASIPDFNLEKQSLRPGSEHLAPVVEDISPSAPVVR